ncbi:MAG: hypothetical protein ACKOYN_00700 [Planctomycetota bacterium]
MSTARSAVAATARACALAVVVLSGCVTTVRPAPPVVAVPPASPPPRNAERVSEGATPAGPQATASGSSVAIDFRTLGSVATDGFTLPLFSPDGRFVAVQTGAAPDRATMLARDGQRPPLDARIALYRLSTRGIERLGETDAGLVLGRSADARGFLVESPRPDGARWIGRIAWGTSAATSGYEPEWLVQDGRVNAFAALGAAGELAYCTRDVGRPAFDLVVRRDGRSMTLGGNGVRSYMLPMLSADGSKVMAIALRDGIVELASAETTSEADMARSLVKSFVTDRGNDETAMQMAAPQGARDGVDGADMLFYHPVLGTVARWNDRDGMRPVAEAALAACRLDGARVVYLSGSAVRVGASREGASPARPGTLVLDRTAVPRALGMVEGAPAVLLLVPERGAVRLVLARFPAAAQNQRK